MDWASELWNILVESASIVCGARCAANVTESTLTIFPVEMHLFSKGGHGFGVGRKADGTNQWVPLFGAWLLRQD